MEYNPVGWFEVPVRDLDRAEAFYAAVLNIEFARQEAKNGMTMSWFPMDHDAKGAAGTLVLSDFYAPGGDRTGVVVYFTAPDLDAALAAVEKAGGSVLVPKKSIGEHGFIAWIKDTEDNTVALHSRTG